MKQTKTIQTKSDFPQSLILLKSSEVRETLKISESTLYRLETSGQLIPDYIIGGRKRYSLQTIQNLLENSRVRRVF
jgi:DNA-binding transcriptional MerR regulator